METLKPPSPGTPPKPNVSPVRLQPKTPIDRGRRPPRLILPSPNVQTPLPVSPYPGSIVSKTSNPNGNPYEYPRKESEFYSGLKGFAKSGLSIGEKSTFWIYNKLSAWSKKWFTHCFLTICLTIYTVGGALIFATVEGRSETAQLDNLRQARYDLIRELRNLSIDLPKQASYAEYQGTASRKIIAFENRVIEAFKNKPLVMANPRRYEDEKEQEKEEKVWTFFNSVVYCATIYTTIGV